MGRRVKQVLEHSMPPAAPPGARTATITASREPVCYVLTYWDFRPLVEANGVIGWKLLQRMAKMLSDARESYSRRSVPTTRSPLVSRRAFLVWHDAIFRRMHSLEQLGRLPSEAVPPGIPRQRVPPLLDRMWHQLGTDRESRAGGALEALDLLGVGPAPAPRTYR